MNKQRIAGPISATLRRNGFSPIASGTSRFAEGVRVHATPWGASVEATHLDDAVAAETIDTAARVLAAAGYSVQRARPRMLVVSRA